MDAFELDHLGSSPLARGTLPSLKSQDRPRRLIPARAGNILTCSCHCGVSPAHPRSRGEHSGKPLYSQGLGGSSPLARGTSAAGRLPRRGGGSSPLARGTFHHVSHNRQNDRLIPALAGNIIKLSSYRYAMTAHPRSRGEHTAGHLEPGHCGGSSPLARGTLLAAAKW